MRDPIAGPPGVRHIAREMLLRFVVENFGPFWGEQVLNLVGPAARKPAASDVLPPGIPRVATIAAVLGANASGKTSILRAMVAAANAVRRSHANWEATAGIPTSLRRPFRLKVDGAARSTRMAFDLAMGREWYSYAFELNDERFLSEQLIHYPAAGRAGKLVFSRTVDDLDFGAGHARVCKPLGRVMRPNSLFLSVAAQNNVKWAMDLQEQLSPYRLAEAANDESRLAYAAARAKDFSAKQRERLRALLGAADIGVVDFEVQSVQIPAAVAEAFQKIRSAAGELVRVRAPAADGEKFGLLHLGHPDDTPTPMLFPLEEESTGTECLLALAVPAMDVLETGNVLIVDELDRSLHPVMVRAIVDLFRDRRINRRGAQLIFSTHQADLLDHLARDEVWFTEKVHGASQLFPLTDFDAGRDPASVDAGYREGRYGAVPRLYSLLDRGEGADTAGDVVDGTK